MDVTKFFNAHKRPLLSFELFPPRSQKGAQNLDKAITELSSFGPDYFSVTFGAGGGQRQGSFELIKKLKNERELPVVAYVAGFGMGPDDLGSVLDNFKDIGIKTVFVIRGDKPTDESFSPHPDSFTHASDMLQFINSKYDFSLGAVGYPEDNRIDYLKQKQDSGAQYIVAQYFYDNLFYYNFKNKCSKAGITIPIIPGIMPIYSHKMTNNLAKTCNTTLPEVVKQGLAAIDPEDKEAVINFGIDFISKQCSDLLKNGASGLHFYTMNRSKSITQILGRLKDENLLSFDHN
ncbi:MAG: methylenetetrahydrofolate reductase [Bacteriovoracaceae bacterium]|nr:methylenetetrahydrofolate reductase [Bacteriovoracaceae bacterium]